MLMRGNSRLYEVMSRGRNRPARTMRLARASRLVQRHAADARGRRPAWPTPIAATLAGIAH